MRGKRSNDSKANEKEALAMLRKSKDLSSDSESDSYDSSDDHTDSLEEFVVGETGTDYQPASKPAPKKKPQPVQANTLFNYQNKKAKKPAAPVKKSSAIDESKSEQQLNDLLAQLGDDSTKKQSKLSKKSKPVKKISRPSSVLSRKNSVSLVESDDDIIENDIPEPIVISEPKQAEHKVEKEIEHEKPKVPTKSTEKKKIMSVKNFAFDEVDDTTTNTDIAIEIKTGLKAKLTEDKSLDFYMFHIQEFGKKLYLFGKCAVNGGYSTVCVRIPTVTYELYFLPNSGEEEDCITEIKNLAREYGFVVFSTEVKKMKYCWEDTTIESYTNWVHASINSKGDITKFKSSGMHYSHLHGVTSTLIENFLLKKDIMGPSWLRISNAKEIEDGRDTSVQLFAIMNDSFLEVLDQNANEHHIPSFNICTLSIRSTFSENEKNSEIYLISMNIFYDWNIEKFDSTNPRLSKEVASKVVTFICGTRKQALSTQFRNAPNIQNCQVCSNEGELLIKFLEEFEKYDFDIVSSFGLNTNDLPLLQTRMIKHKVHKWITRLGRVAITVTDKEKNIDVLKVIPGRLPSDLRIGTQEFVRSKQNDFSSIVKQELNKERQNIEHVDVASLLSEDSASIRNLINYNKADTQYVADLLKKIQIIPLTLEISRLSGCPWSRVLLGQATHRCESLFLHKFHTRNFVLPDKTEVMKGMNEKRKAKYSGGMVLDPKKGFYETCIMLLDFNSLYPSIIREYNICFTTVDRSDPDAQESKKKSEGILPCIMSELLTARSNVKKDLKKAEDALLKISEGDPKKHKIEVDKQRANIKQLAIKVLANSMYGYLGYRGSRFQATELASLITKQGREILENTRDMMENKQYTVVYGDTDSVMVNSNTTDVKEAIRIAKELGKDVSKKYQKLELGVDGIFRKMLLVQKKKYAALLYQDENHDKIETKGLDMVRRDWCGLTKISSLFIIDQFMKASSREVAVENILNELKIINEMLDNNGEPIEGRPSKRFGNGIKLEHFVIYKSLTKPLDQYVGGLNKIPEHVLVARWMRDNTSQSVNANDTIPYVITKSTNKEDRPQYYKNAKYEDIDLNYYRKSQMLQPLWRLCEPFGSNELTMGMISNALGLTVVTHQERDNDQSSTASFIDHLFDLAFTCPDCQFRTPIPTKIQDTLKCGKCETEFNWKFVANKCTEIIRNFILTKTWEGKITNDGVEQNEGFDYVCSGFLCTYKTNQLPVSDLHPLHENGFSAHKKCESNLKSSISPVEIYHTLRYFVALFEPSPSDANEFQSYMYNLCKGFLDLHGFSHLKFGSIFHEQETEEVIENEEED